MNQAASEALNLASAAGISPELAFETLEASAACAPMLKYRRNHYLDEQSQPVTFTVSLAQKDVLLATQLALALDVRMPRAQLNLEVLRQADQDGFGERDMASIINYLGKGKL